MNIITGAKIQEDILKKVESELGRKLTENELEVFYKTSRIALIRGERYRSENN